jgi:acyl-CoA synthetase (AMP-forming)/AMP-acid ligase II
MFISSGENVYSAEVENVLYQHPAVAQATVVSTPDPRPRNAIGKILKTELRELLASQDGCLGHRTGQLP